MKHTQMKLQIVNPCFYFRNILLWNTSSTELPKRVGLVLDELNLETKFYYLSISQMKIPRKVPKIIPLFWTTSTLVDTRT